jgi:carboxymethylenebutenolidase
MGEIVRLKAADDHAFSAYHVAATGDRGRLGGLVVIQEIFGVNDHIRGVCDAYGKKGYEVYSPALFDRVESDVELGYEEADMERGIELRGALKDSEFLLDVQACVAEKRGEGEVGVVGYCFGGLVSWLSACRLVGVSAAACYYGGGIANQLDGQTRCPVIMHFGALDSMIPLSDVDKIRAAHAGVEIHVYDNADHGFNCDQRSSYQKAAASLAFDRTLAFFTNHVG